MRGRKPTRNQKNLISYYRLNPANWLVCGEDRDSIRIMHRHTSTVKMLKKLEVSQ